MPSAPARASTLAGAPSSTGLANRLALSCCAQRKMRSSSPSGRTTFSARSRTAAMLASTMSNAWPSVGAGRWVPAITTMRRRTMSTTEPAIKVHRGLKDVYFERSQATFIDGKAGELRYRGYSIHDLARRSTFEETAYLLLHGELPGRAELARLDAELKAARTLPPPILGIIEMVKSAHPMDVLRTAVSALAAFDPEVGDNSR